MRPRIAVRGLPCPSYEAGHRSARIIRLRRKAQSEERKHTVIGATTTVGGEHVQSCTTFRTSIAGIAYRAGLLFGVSVLAFATSAMAQTGTTFCEPGQAGVVICPCNNPPAGTGMGCANFGPGQIGQSSILTASGTASVTNGSDTLQFVVTGENDFVLSVFLQGSATTTGVSYGAGVSCLANAPVLLYHGNAGTGEPNGQITRPRTGLDPEVHVQSALMGDTISAGQTRFYMVGYRDKKASSIPNCNDPTKTFNASQGVAIVWGP